MNKSPYCKDDFRRKSKKQEISNDNDVFTWRFLGGNNKERIGANCGLAEYFDEETGKKTSLLFDIGVMQADSRKPENDVLVDCDTIIPDISAYLAHKNKIEERTEHKLDAIFLTHSHTDHIEGISYMMLMGYEMPKIYATPFTARRLYQSFENQNIPPEEWPEVTEIAPGQKVIEGKVTVTAFSVSHSTPQSVGFYIESPEGNVVQPGDFKLDKTLTWGPGFNKDQFDSIVCNGVDLLLLDSTGADKNKKPVTEKNVRTSLTRIFNKHAEKRFVIASMGGFEETLASVAQVTSKNKRTLWVAGWSHEQALLALEGTGLSLSDHLGYEVDLRVVKSVKTIRELSEKDAGESVVLVTGAQGKNFAILTQAADKKSKILKLDKDKDIILFCSPTIPGKDMATREKLVSYLKKQGYTVFTNRDMTLYSHGHGRLPEILEMAKMAKAKTIAPVHGSKYLRQKNEEALKKKGHTVLNVDNGTVLEIKKSGVRVDKKKSNETRLIGFKTRTGKHWQERDYFAIFSPQPEENTLKELKTAKNKKKPTVFTVYPRKPS